MKRLTCFILASLLALALVGCSGISRYPAYPDAEKYAIGNASVTDEITNVQIDWVMGSVIIQKSAEASISFSEKVTGLSAVQSENGFATLDDAHKLHYLVDGSTLIIRFCESELDYSGTRQKELTLTLPDTLALDKLTVNTASASVRGEGVTAENVSVNTASGRVDLLSVNCKNAEINSASGAVVLSLTAEKTECAEINSASGSVTLSAPKAVDKLDISTASGKITLNTTSVAAAKIAASSGSVEFICAATPGKCNISTSSGSVRMTLPEDASFTADVTTGSGKFSTDFAAVTSGTKHTVGDGAAKFEITTSSGSVTIAKAK